MIKQTHAELRLEMLDTRDLFSRTFKFIPRAQLQVLQETNQTRLPSILIEFSQQEIDVMWCSGVWLKECPKDETWSLDNKNITAQENYNSYS